MRKLVLSLAICLCALTASAQQKWAIGGRIGSGVQAQAELRFASQNYVEARFGLYYATAGATAMADFTALYNWNVCSMNWTPKAGEWFFDAGIGLNVGGREHYAYVGPAGCARLGIKFKNAPVRLAIDWTPAFGAGISYWSSQTIVMGNNSVKIKGGNSSEFNKWGLCNFGLSCVYCF